MSIVVKVARSAQELTDVYRLRHQVYSNEGTFSQVKTDMIHDHFDTLPRSESVIAYADGVPVGTMRVTCDSEIGLPADMHYDFSGYRNDIVCEAKELGLPQPLFLNAGMLAIDDNWRNRRDVFKAIFKIGCDVAKAWGCTHIISAVNEKTTTIYRRLGFNILADRFYYAEADDYVVPVGSELQKVFDWAFSADSEASDLLQSFSGSFEYLMVSAGQSVFKEGDPGDCAYLISSGVVNITSDKFGEETLSLATLGPGEFLGEMSIIDGKPRSANAVAIGNCELIVLPAEVFWQKAQDDAENMRSLLRLLSSRVREIGIVANLYARGNLEQRLLYFINRLQRDAKPSAKQTDCFVVKITLEEIASLSNATLEQTQVFLQRLEQAKLLELTSRTIKFFVQNPIVLEDVEH